MPDEIRIYIAPSEQECRTEEGSLREEGWTFIRTTNQSTEITALVQDKGDEAIAELNHWFFIARK